MKFSVKNLIFIFAKPSEYELQMLKKYLFSFFLLITFLGFAQTPTNTHILDNSGVKVPDVLYYCQGENFNWKVDAQASSTGNYQMIEDNSISISAGTIPVPFPDKVGNNKFSSPLTIGFPFEFYGKTYTRVVVGGNGRLVFSNSPELDQLSTNMDLLHSGNGTPAASTNVKIPSPEYNRISNSDPTKKLEMAQIFAGYTDLHYNIGSEYNKVTYLKTIYAGKQVLVVSFTGVVEVNNSSYTTVLTNQIILFSDNTYLIRVIRKSNVQNTIFGVQNETGTKAVWPVNNDPTSPYNNGKWSVTSAPVSYLFKPSENLTPQISWTRNGTAVTNLANYTFSPTQNTENVQVKIKFVNDAGVQIGNDETSSVILNKIQPVVVKDPVYTSGCGNPAKLEIDSPLAGLTYHWFEASNPTVEIGSGTVINVGTGSYIAKAKSSSGGFCGESLPKVVNVASILPVFAPPVGGYTFCDNLGSSSKIIDLNTLTSYPADATKYTVTFLENGTPISSSVTMNSGTSRNFTIKVETLASVTPSCTFVANFTVNYQSFPINGTVVSPTNKLCFDANSYSINQFKVDFPQYASFDVKFSSDNVNFDSNYKNPHNPIYVELKKSGFTCSSVIELKVNFYDEIVVKPYTQFPAHCFSSTEYFDLNVTKNQLEYGNVKARFYTSYVAGVFSNEVTNLHFRGSGKIYVELIGGGDCVYNGAPPELNLEIYRKPVLIKTTPELKKSTCGTNTYNLTTNIQDYIGVWNRYSEIRYFDGSGTRMLNSSDWESYNADVRGTPYMEFYYNSTNNGECSDRINFTLQTSSKPVAFKTTFPICGETTYASSRLVADVIANPSNYTFTMSDGSPLPMNFDMSSLPKTITILIKDNASGCVSDPIDITFLQGQATPILTASPVQYSLCDSVGDAYDGITFFDLNSKKSSFTNDATAKVQFYTDAARQNEVQANFTNATAFNQMIYVKITAIGACPSFGELALKVNSPTKSTTLNDKYMICFGSQVSVDAGTENVKFNWSGGVAGSTPNIRVFDKAGTYSVVLENTDGCSYTHSFVVSDEQQPKVQIIQDNTKIEVIASGGVSPYRYSFDGGLTFQNSNILLNPTDKEYVIQVQSTLDAANGLYCNGKLLYIYSIVIPNAITPNGDGINDMWTVPNLDKMDQVEIVITDRFGKNVFKTSDKNQLIWDGKHNGKPLVTGTYWYVVKWFDPSTKKNEVRQGWILLKNRN